MREMILTLITELKRKPDSAGLNLFKILINYNGLRPAGEFSISPAVFNTVQKFWTLGQNNVNQYTYHS